MPMSNKKVVEQIANVLSRATRAMYYDNDGFACIYQQTNARGIITTVCQTVKQFAPSGSEFLHALAELESREDMPDGYHLENLISILTELQYAFESDLFQTIRELARAELYDDLLGGAKYLLEEGWKDAAAVMIGSVFEENLRKLCVKHGINPFTSDPTPKPKKANTLNQELAGNKIYDQFTSKSVILWLDVRNNAAHGHRDKYDAEKVAEFCHFVEQFLANHLA
jgi:hypothetical protein